MSTLTEPRDLPDDVFSVVMQYLDFKQLLGPCALVQQRWQQAAIKATNSISLNLRSTIDQPKHKPSAQQRLDGMLKWINQHGQHITSLDLIGRPTLMLDVLQLPCQQLHDLKLAGFSLQLQALGTGSAEEGTTPLQSCTGLPGLQQLSLSHCKLTDGPDSLSALSALSSLRHLELRYLTGCDDSSPHSLPCSLLSQITHLSVQSTRLCASTLQKLSSLMGLRELALENAGPNYAKHYGELSVAPPLQHLQQLTHLRWMIEELTLTAAADHGLSYLTGLRHLELHGSPGWIQSSQVDPSHLPVIDPAVLAGMTQLRHLVLRYTRITDRPAGVAALLMVLAGLQQLQHLHVDHTLEAVTEPTAYSALTMSSELEVLYLTNCKLPAQVWQHVFHPGQLAASLHTLDLSQSTKQLHAEVPLEASDLAALVRCCPALHDLNLYKSVTPGTSLAALSQLQQLRRLVITGVTNSSAQDLSQLTSLTELYISEHGMDRLGLLLLTHLKQLSKLRVTFDGPEHQWRINNKVDGCTQ